MGTTEDVEERTYNNGETINTLRQFSDEEKAYNEAFSEKFGTNDNSFLVVLHAENSLLTQDGVTDILSLTNTLKKNEGVDSSYSIASLPDNTSVSPRSLMNAKLKPAIEGSEATPEETQKLTQLIEQSELVNGNLISKDHTYALILLTINEAYSSPKDFYPILQNIQATVEEWQANQSRQEYTIIYGGLPYIRALTVDAMKVEQLILWPVVGIVYFIALLVVFRNFFQALFPLLSIFVVVLWSIAVMVITNEPVTMINNTMPMLILVVGVTNGIYVLLRILDERRAGLEVRPAIVSGVSKVAVATFLTTLTTAIGFGSLIIAKSHILNSFGAIIAMAIMLIYVTIIVMMPLLVSFLKLKPRKIKKDDKKEGVIEFFSQKLASFTTKHSKAVLISALVLFAGLAWLGSTVPFDSKVNDVFEPDHPVTQANRIIEDNLGGILPLEVDIVAEPNTFRSAETLKQISDLQDKIKQVDGVLVTLSMRDILREAQIDFDKTSQLGLEMALAGIVRLQPEQLYAFVTPDMSNLHISVRLPDAGVKKTRAVINQVDKLCKETFQNTPGITYRLTGTAYNCALGLDAFTKDLAYSLATAFIIIFFVLIIAFRSFWVGIIALLPNLLPIVMTLSSMLLYGYELNTTSVLVFTISIGLAVDNSIHIISRFQQEYAEHQQSVSEAIIKAMKSSGRAILESNFLLIIGLSLLLISSFEPISRVGVLTMTTIASALITSLTVLPAEINLLGKRMGAKKKSAENAEQPPKPETQNA